VPEVEAMKEVTFLAPRGLRWGGWVSALLGLLLMVLAVTGLLGGDRHFYLWFMLVVSPLQVAYYIWFASRAHRPVVRITDAEVLIRPILSRDPAVVERGELVGLRWQDSFDLRVCLRSGGEHSILMKQIARRDRHRLHDLLREIVRGA
jgi:hypothetical protein